MRIMTAERVLIAGGGPVGMVTALALAQRGFPVTVFEAERKSTARRARRPRIGDAGAARRSRADRRGHPAGLTRAPSSSATGRAAQLIAEFDHELLRQETPFRSPCSSSSTSSRGSPGAAARVSGAEAHFSARVAGVDARAERRGYR